MNTTHYALNLVKTFKNIRFDDEKTMLLSAIFFFGATVIFALVKYVLKTFKYSPPHEPILLILGIIMGRICSHIPKDKRCIELFCKNITEWSLVVVSIMYYRVCYFTEFSRNSKLLAQTLLFGILGTALSSAIIGVAMKIIENKEVTLQMSLVLGLTCVPIYSKGSKEVKGFGATITHVNNFLDGEALVGTVTVFFIISVILVPPGMKTLPENLLRYMLQLILGSGIGWVAGSMICRLMVKFADLPTVILVIFFVPLIVSVFVRCCGFNEDLAMIIQLLLICKNRGSLRKETEDFYGQFIHLLYALITDISLVFVGMFVGEQFTSVQLLSSIPYVMSMYVVVICGRFFSFAVLSSLFNKCDLGLTLPQLGLVIWCGVPSVINVFMLMNVHQHFGFENNDFVVEMTRDLIGVVILGYLINTWCISPIISSLGLIKSSLARDVNMNISFRSIMDTRARSILILKLERWFCDAHWITVKKGTELVHPYWTIASNDDRDKEVFRFAICNHCNLEFFVPPSYKEYQEMRRGARRRVLQAKKNFYIKQYSIGMLSEESYRMLAEGIEEGLESPNVEFDTNKLLNMIRKVNWMDDNAQKLCNNYEYRFMLMYPKNMSNLRRCVMNTVVHPLFDLSINMAALLNLGVDFYYFLSHEETPSGPLFLTIYSCFLGVYLSEMTLKMYFFKVRMFIDGVFHYFCSFWNLMDAVLVVMTCLVVLSLSYSVFYKTVMAVAAVSTIRIVRILRLLRNFKACKPLVLLIPRLYGDMCAKRAYETGKTFIKGEHELMAVIPGMVKDPHITAGILNQMDEDIVLIVREVERIQQNRPKVAINIKTKQAIRTVLNFMKEEVDFMKNAGWIDEIEYKLLLKSVYERYQHLHTLRKVRCNSPKTFFDDIPWLNGNDSLKEFLFENIQTRQFSPRDVIIAKDEHAGGIYIAISGLLMIEYEPDFFVLEQLQLFGVLPVVDFIVDPNFGEYRKDYIVAGNTFGELSILTKRPYSSHVTADSFCELMFIPEECIRSAMDMDNDPISGLWRNVCRKLTLDLLLNARPYRTTPLDEVRQCLDRCFAPKLKGYRAIARTEYIEDIVVIEGSVMDERTRTYFMAPRHLPRSIQTVFLPGNPEFSLDTEIETKLVLVTIPGVSPEFIMAREREFNDTFSASTRHRKFVS